MDSLYLTNRLKQAVPASVTRTLWRGKTSWDARRNTGDQVWCPVCERTFTRFLAFNGRSGAMCPGCRSMERQRLMMVFFAHQTTLLTHPQKLLHVAPEAGLEARLRSITTLEYSSGDLFRKEADLRIDVTDIDLPDESFDVILCSHVLEHVADDRQAMRELRRILKPGGWAILDAPIDPTRDDTFEDWSVTSPKDRARVFGQWDHVRTYGRNYADLLRESGWSVTVDPIEVDMADATRMGLRQEAEHLYLCTMA